MDLYRVLVGLDGKPLKVGEHDLRLVEVIADALLTPIFEDEPAEQKIFRGRLARRLITEKVEDLLDGEKSLIKRCADQCVQSPLILSYVHDELQ